MKIFPLLVLMTICIFSPVQAASKRHVGVPKTNMQPTPIVELTPEEKAAKAALDTLSAHLSNAEGLVYAANLSFATGSPGNVTIKQITNQVTIEKTAKMNIEAFVNGQPDGVLNASGSLLTLYDAAAGKYATVTTSSDLLSALNALDIGGRQLFQSPSPTESDLYVSFAFPDLFFARRFYNQDAVNGISVKYSKSPSTVDGQQVEVLTQTFSRGQISRTLAFAINPANFNPVQFSQSQTVGLQPPVPVLTVDFTSFQLITTPLPASTYTYSPPSTAELVQAPTPPAATSGPSGTAPSTPPTTTTP